MLLICWIFRMELFLCMLRILVMLCLCERLLILWLLVLVSGWFLGLLFWVWCW